MIKDFDTVIDRSQFYSVKWQAGEETLPMWVADMDFETAPVIKVALKKAVDHGVYGYTKLPARYFEAVQSWWKRRYDCHFDQEAILYSSSVVGSLATIIRAFTEVNDEILVQSPVYHMFYHVIESNQRIVCESPLNYDGQAYQMNFEDLEAKLSRPQVKMMVLCQPHNPIGVMWSHQVLTRLVELCKQYEVQLISDEIHGDITKGDTRYIPVEKVAQEQGVSVITLTAPTKTFNLAGIQASNVMVSDPDLREKVNQALSLDFINHPTLLGITATIAAYEEGESWLNDLRQVIDRNRDDLDQMLKTQFPKIRLLPSQATYLMWLDISELTEDSDAFVSFLKERTGLIVTSGHLFRGNGHHFIRMNIACPHALLIEGINRLIEGAKAYQAV